MPQAPCGTAGLLSVPVRVSCDTYSHAQRVATALATHGVVDASLLRLPKRRLTERLTAAGVPEALVRDVHLLRERNARIGRTQRCRVNHVGGRRTLAGLSDRMTKGPRRHRHKVVEATLFVLAELAAIANVSAVDLVGDILAKADHIAAPDQPAGLE